MEEVDGVMEPAAVKAGVLQVQAMARDPKRRAMVTVGDVFTSGLTA